MNEIILASGSPRRKQLLQWAEVPFTIHVEPTDESYPAALAPTEVAVHIARKKNEVMQKLMSGRVILSADTIVVWNEEIIGKPAGREDAVSILSKLSGTKHRVITGVVITGPGKEIAFADTTIVTFHPLTKEQIAFYVDKYQPYDKAGAYAIQEWIGVTGIKSIEGDFYNVMGLPVSRVVQALREFTQQ